MSQKRKLLLLCIIMIVLLAVSAAAYHYLSAWHNASLLSPTPESGGAFSQNAPSGEDQTNSPEEDAFSSAIPAADFIVYDRDGEPVKLSNFYGKPIVLNFWASWCPPCKSEMPEFNKIYLEMGDDVTFLMIDLVDGAREKQEDGEEYVLQQGFAFPVYYDLDQQAAYAYQVISIPTTYFIDAEGNITTYAMGAINEDTLRMGIDMALGVQK